MNSKGSEPIKVDGLITTNSCSFLSFLLFCTPASTFMNIIENVNVTCIVHDKQLKRAFIIGLHNIQGNEWSTEIHSHTLLKMRMERFVFVDKGGFPICGEIERGFPVCGEIERWFPVCGEIERGVPVCGEIERGVPCMW